MEPCRRGAGPQAVTRVQRMGQTREVIVFRYVTKDTIEEVD